MRYAALGLPLLLLAVLSWFLWRGLLEGMPVSPSGVRVGVPLPQFSLSDLHGAPVSNRDLPAAPFLLNVWASWCPGCVVEHGLLQDAARGGVPLVCLDWRDPPADALRWLERWGDPCRVHISDPEGRLALELGVSGAPETFAVDGAGVVRAHHLGVLDEPTLQDLLALLEEAR